MEFLGTLRELSGGKPVGFKLCLGRPEEFAALTKAMLKTGVVPDFITVRPCRALSPRTDDSLPVSVSLTS